MATSARPAAPCCTRSDSRARISRKARSASLRTWSMVTPCNMHIDQLARQAEAGVNAAGGEGGHLQHDHHFRRHLDGHRGDEILARLARSDRRLHRDGDGLRRVRRARGDRRLRQEHARLPDGHGAAEPAQRVRLWRHDSARLHHRRARGEAAAQGAGGAHRGQEARCRELLRGGRPAREWHASTTANWR